MEWEQPTFTEHLSSKFKPSFDWVRFYFSVLIHIAFDCAFFWQLNLFKKNCLAYQHHDFDIDSL